MKTFSTRAAIVALGSLLLIGVGSNLASIQAQEEEGPNTGANNAINDVPSIMAS